MDDPSSEAIVTSLSFLSRSPNKCSYRWQITCQRIFKPNLPHKQISRFELSRRAWFTTSTFLAFQMENTVVDKIIGHEYIQLNNTCYRQAPD